MMIEESLAATLEASRTLQERSHDLKSRRFVPTLSLWLSYDVVINAISRKITSPYSSIDTLKRCDKSDGERCDAMSTN